MFGADAKALFAAYFQIDKSQFFQCIVQLIYTTCHKLFVLVFVTNYPISCQLLTDITFGYPLIGQFDTIWQDLFPNICLVFYFYTITFTGGNSRMPGNSHKSLRKVECFTVILILSFNKNIRTLT